MSLENLNQQPGGSLTQEEMIASGNNDFANDANDNGRTDEVSQPSMAFNDFSFVGEEEDENNPLANVDQSWSNAADDDPRYEQNQEGTRQEEENNNPPAGSQEENPAENNYSFTAEDILTPREDAEVTTDSIAGVDPQTQNSPMSVQSAMDFLREKGIDIPQQADADLARQNSIGQISNEIFELNKILNLPESEFLKIAIRNQKSNDFRKQGKESLIGSQEFENEITDALDEFGINSTFKDMFINSHQRSLSDYIKEKDNQLNGLKTQDLQVKEQKIIEINNQRLQSLEKLSKEYGLNLNEAQTAYEFMNSNEYKEIVNDPDFIVQSVVAELARRRGVKLFNKQDDGYARGVSDVLEDIKNQGSGRTSKSQLGTQMSGSQHLQTSPEERNPWLAFNSGGIEVDESKKRNNKAAGGF